ncbi:hypothetical protein LJC04_00110 [Ruminococcaceae bacterium OttesenSCG-928-O06]|nr:hypothetical protein [Ruminococcaceae bacterium OttesenSCG-928-O06]
MEDTKALLRFHLSLYPGMEPLDCIKLLYQSEMGGGHLIADEAAFARRLTEELDTPGLFTAAPPPAEPLGGGLCRVHLAGLGAGPAPATIARLCALAAAAHVGSPHRLAQKLEVLVQMAEEGQLPWRAAALRPLVEEYIAGGCPAPHHSARFAALYPPHYRIMRCGDALFLPVFAALDAALGQKPHVLAGIDGMSGAGKSALAALLATVYGCGVVHADDFFLQPQQRTPQRLMAAGGNIDYERLAQVAARAAEGRGLSYQAYNCQTLQLQEWRTLLAHPLTLIEGVYALHPQVAAPCDVRMFLAVDAALQARRVLHRSGPQLAQRFFEEWIPMENRYFAEFAIREGCDVVVDTTPLG